MERYFKEKWDEKFNNCKISEGEEVLEEIRMGSV